MNHFYLFPPKLKITGQSGNILFTSMVAMGCLFFSFLNY